MLCRVLDIMRTDAEKDPASNPNALHARLLINEVSIFNRVCIGMNSFIGQ